jgi:ADP-ribose pyrophosphatase YjhB (NUDIX family)
MKRTLAKLWKLLKLPKHIQLFIMRLTNDEFLVGVTGVIVNKKNEVLLLKHTYRQTEWSLPGGYLQRGEHPLEGMEREVFEETGLKVKGEKIIRTSHDRDTARLDISCFGRFVSGKFVESVEVVEHGFFPINQFPDIGKKQKKLIAYALQTETNIQLPPEKSGFFRRFSKWFYRA